MNDDLITLIEDDDGDAPLGPPWKVLVVDDEQEVHSITRVALSDFEFAGCGLELLHAHSGAEAAAIVDRTPDIAVMLVDVVMETDHAGLDFVRHVREVAQLRFPRIILRTGQPGQAPERQVITEYDINDYKQKTELTQQKMFTVMHTSIASYRDLMALNNSRHGLRKVIEASAQLFELQSMERFAQGVLEQLAALLYLHNEALVLRAEGLAAEKQNGDMEILAGTGRFAEYSGRNAREVLPEPLFALLAHTAENGGWVHGDSYFTAMYRTAEGVRNILYIASGSQIGTPDRELIELYCRCVGRAHDNLRRVLAALGDQGLPG